MKSPDCASSEAPFKVGRDGQGWFFVIPGSDLGTWELRRFVITQQNLCVYHVSHRKSYKISFDFQLSFVEITRRGASDDRFRIKSQLSPLANTDLASIIQTILVLFLNRTAQ